MANISILGCGWLGLPLAQKLTCLGHRVMGSTQSPGKFGSIRKSGAHPFRISLNPTIEGEGLSAFFNSEILIVNFPPKRRDDIVSFHTQQVQSLLQQLNDSPISKLIFVSSTSVYPATNGVVTEALLLAPEKASGKALLIAEDLFMQAPNLDCTVVRFAGLIGGDRVPGRFLAGKRDLKDGAAPVNLIHRDDCLAILVAIIENGTFGQVFNACADEHPLRETFYKQAARKAGLPEPVFVAQQQPAAYKIVSSEKLKQQLGYRFLYPDPLIVLDQE